MRFIKPVILVSAFLIVWSCTSEQPAAFHPASWTSDGPWFGGNLPDHRVELMAPGFISTGMNERDAAFTPDGKEFYYSVWLPSRKGVIMVSRQTSDRKWSRPEVASFSGLYSDIEPFISPDGKFMYFSSNRPKPERGTAPDYDIWVMHRTQTGWSDPENLGNVVNSAGNEFYPSVSKSKNLYFTAELDADGSGENIYACYWLGNGYLPPENLGSMVNSELGDYNALIAPDEAFLIFGSWGRGDGFGGGDLYICFNDDAGGWTAARNLGSVVNSSALDFCPALTPDSMYLIFSSNRLNPDIPADQPGNYSALVDIHLNPQNGNGDLYWLSIDRILELKPSSNEKQ